MGVNGRSLARAVPKLHVHCAHQVFLWLEYPSQVASFPKVIINVHREKEL